MPSPSAGRKRKEPSSPTETNSNATKDAKLASGLYKELPSGRLEKLCSVEGCGSFTQNSGVCTRHGANRRICSYEGCENLVKQGGVCTRHGAKRRICSHEGCTNYARGSIGVCIRHGANEFVKKRKSSAVVSDNEDDTNNDNNQQRQTRRRIQPPTTSTTTTAQNNSIGSEANLHHAAGSNNGTETNGVGPLTLNAEVSSQILSPTNHAETLLQRWEREAAKYDITSMSTNQLDGRSSINDNTTDSIEEDNRITHVGDDWGGDENDDYDPDTVTTNNEQQQSNLLATDEPNCLCVVINERNQTEKR